MRRILTILLAVIFVLSSVALAQDRRMMMRQVQTPPEQPEQLTAEQKEEIQKLQQEWNKKKIQIEADRKIAQIEFQELMKDGSATESQIRSQLEKNAALDVGLKLGGIMLQKSLQELMTPEQWKQFQQQQKMRDVRKPKETLLNRMRQFDRRSGIRGVFHSRGRTFGRIGIIGSFRRTIGRSSPVGIRGTVRERINRTNPRRSDSQEFLQRRSGDVDRTGFLDNFRGTVGRGFVEDNHRNMRSPEMPMMQGRMGRMEERSGMQMSMRGGGGSFDIRSFIENFRGMLERSFRDGSRDVRGSEMPMMQGRMGRMGGRSGMQMLIRRGGGGNPGEQVKPPQPPPAPVIPVESEEIYLLDEITLGNTSFEAPPPPPPAKHEEIPDPIKSH